MGTFDSVYLNKIRRLEEENLKLKQMILEEENIKLKQMICEIVALPPHRQAEVDRKREQYHREKHVAQEQARKRVRTITHYKEIDEMTPEEAFQHGKDHNLLDMKPPEHYHQNPHFSRGFKKDWKSSSPDLEDSFFIN